MKNEYNPYPSVNPERIGTFQYEDYEWYIHTFYNDKDFHVKRLERGKEIVKRDKIKIALYSVLVAILGAATVNFGYSALRDIFDIGAAVMGVNPIINPEISGSKLVLNLFASIVTAGLANGITKEELIETIKHLSRVKKDIGASEEMIRVLTKS